ncbi:ERF family protein [Leifsonia sp. NPDC056824]|uniref:ERF family protein n=1 Tax=Leifsonia sp. NPDC056824 TaxID=3345953 RepID=UPI00368DF149
MAAHENLAAALAAFQTELPTIKKDNQAKVETRNGGEYKYQYADLADISPRVLPLLGKHGLSWTTKPTFTVNGFVLAYRLKHESGESVKGEYPLPDPSTPPQQLGSAITYARRYALCAVTGVAPGGDDDDAASAPAAPRQSRPAAKSKPAPAAPSVPVATVDWAAQIIDATSEEQLRQVHKLVEDAGELGRMFDPQYAEHLSALMIVHRLPMPPADVKVGQVIAAVRHAILVDSSPEPESDDAPMALGDPVTEWETAEPGSGVRFEETPEP